MADRKYKIGRYGQYSIFKIGSEFFCDSPEGAKHFDVHAKGGSREEKRKAAPRQLKNFWRACDVAAKRVADGEIDASDFPKAVEDAIQDREKGKKKFEFTKNGARLAGRCGCLAKAIGDQE